MFQALPSSIWRLRFTTAKGRTVFCRWWGNVSHSRPMPAVPLAVALQSFPTALQIAELQAEAEQARREEQAAKAVLQAATAAAKEGRSLTREEVAEVENPILSAGDTESEPPQPPSGRLGGLFGATRKVCA